MASVPTIDPERRHHDPAARLRRLPDRRRRRPRRRSTHGARGRLPPHRHRADVRQRGGRRRGASRASGIDRDEVFVTSKLNNGFHRARRRPRARSTRRSTDARPRPRRPVPDPLAAAHAATTATSSRPGRPWRSSRRDGRARSIGVSNFQPAHLERLVAETDVVPGGQPDRGAPVLHATRRCARYGATHGIVTEAWSPIAQGEVLDDPVDHRDRRAARPDARAGRRCAGTSSAATSSSRSRSRRSGCEENFAIFDFELDTRGPRGDHRARPGRGRPHRPEPGHVRLHPGLSVEGVAEDPVGVEARTERAELR